MSYQGCCLRVYVFLRGAVKDHLKKLVILEVITLKKKKNWGWRGGLRNDEKTVSSFLLKAQSVVFKGLYCHDFLSH